MKRRIALFATIATFSVVMATPPQLHAQQAQDPDDHSAHHPATTQAPPQDTGALGASTSPAKLDELVKKMNSAQGEAKTAAIAELLTALVQDRQGCKPMMAKMKQMMDTNAATGGTMPAPRKAN